MIEVVTKPWACEEIWLISCVGKTGEIESGEKENDRVEGSDRRMDLRKGTFRASIHAQSRRGWACFATRLGMFCSAIGHISRRKRRRTEGSAAPENNKCLIISGLQKRARIAYLEAKARPSEKTV